MSSGLVVSSIATALLGGTAVLIAAAGELLVEKTGIYNIGLEGVMLLGGLGGYATMSETGNVWLGMLGGIAAGALFVIPFALATVIFRADMLMAGLALVLIGTGLSGQLGERWLGTKAEATLPRWEIPLLKDIPYVGDALFHQVSLVYVAFLLPFAVGYLLNRTRHGLRLQAVGEDPVTADIAGIPVDRIRFGYVVVGGAFAGAAGAFVTLGVIEGWVDLATAGQGWIALAIVIFAGWRALPLIAGAYLFGALGTLGNVGQALGWDVPSQVFSALPYLGTLTVLLAAGLIRHYRRGLAPWPEGLGQAFFRGAG